MNVKSAGIIPLLAIIICFTPALCEKLVEITSPIVTLRSLPSATSDSRGIAQKGKRLIVDGESGQWFRSHFYNATVWLPKSSVNVLESTDPVTPPAAAPGAGGPGTARSPQNAGQTVHPQGTPGAETHKGTETATASATPGSAAASAPAPLGLTVTPAAGAVPVSGGPPITATGTADHAANAPLPAPKPRRAYRPPNGGRWVTQFSHISQEESGKEQFFFQIADKKAVIYSLSTTGAPVVAEAKKGDFFPLLEEAGTWCKIALQDTTGWIERAAGAIVSTPKSGINDELLIVVIAAILIAVTTAVILTIVVRRKTRTKSQKGDRFRSLIIAKTTPPIHCIISDKTLSMEKYLNAIGCAVKSLHILSGAQKVISRFPPDVVFIDWNITDDIPGMIEALFSGFDETKLPLAIFYNVPDVSDVPLIPILFRAYYLGRSFSDHDISKLITPAMLSRTSQKSSAASALEGDIAEGNLPEIMQFIEIGKKSGCLLIETDSPLGMIYFAQGRIIHAAAANNVTGRDAINILLNLKHGKFRFLLNKEPKTSDLNLSTLEVLMEWTKTEDEAHRD
jgi:hypothetical protein